MACGGRLAPIDLVRDDAAIEAEPDAAAPIACLTPDAGGLCELPDGSILACNACLKTASFIVFEEEAGPDGSVVGEMTECVARGCPTGWGCAVQTPKGFVYGKCD